MSRSKIVAIATLITTTSVLLAGCSTTATNSASPTASNTPSATSTPAVQYEIAPLTGMRFIKGTNPYLSGPAIMGKVDNAPAARPQNSLNKSDVVFEELVEGGMTRFLAIWQSNLPDKYGPVRSVRPMDPDLAAPFGGIISFSGGNREFVAAMQRTDVFVTNETNQLGKNTFERVTNRFAPHNVMVHARTLARQHRNIAAPKTQFNFADALSQATAFIAGKPVTSFAVNFPSGRPSWSWNETARRWLRSQYGVKETDATDGKQLHATNVVVLKTRIDRSFKNFRYGYIPRTVVVGGGSGYVFSGGKVLAITFQKKNQNDPIHLFDSAGKPVLLSPGNTWVELMPKDVGSINIKYAKVVATASASPTATK